MTRLTTAIAAALSLLPLGQPLLLGSTTALATAAVVFSTQAAHAQSAEDYVKSGQAKFKSRDYQGAIADYNKAIEINPQYAPAYVMRASFFVYSRRNLQESIADYTKAIEINPQYTIAYLMRGITKSILKDYQAAISDYSKVIEINPQFTTAYEIRGDAKKALGDIEFACADWKEATALGSPAASMKLEEFCQ